MAASASDPQAEQISAVIQEIRERVRARYPQGEAQGLGVALPDLLPVLHARDVAASKVAAIGSVNPRPPGLINNLIQWVKRTVARALGWFVRDQVEFNRAVLISLEATLEALNEANRTFVAVGNRLQSAESDARVLADFRSHWTEWRTEWQGKLAQNERWYLKSVAELQRAVDLRFATAAANHDDALRRQQTDYAEALRRQHAEYGESLGKALNELQQRWWADAERIRLEYERLIHNELRVMRQKALAGVAFSRAPAAPVSAASPEFDYARFSDRFRGTEEYVRERLQVYVPHFSECRSVLDIGCGRGEFLELMREAGVPARGVDLDPESVALCRHKGLQAETADVFEMLAREPEHAFDGIFAAQVVEHLRPAQVPALVKLCASRLKSGGVLALETPNPECLAIFATHFYLDPTHQRPVPPSLLSFYLEEFGFGGIQVLRLSPAIESLPSVGELPQGFREAFFGALDYGIIGRKL